MKRRDFLQHLALHHCTILREGSSHTILQNNTETVDPRIPRVLFLGSNVDSLH